MILLPFPVVEISSFPANVFFKTGKAQNPCFMRFSVHLFPPDFPNASFEETLSVLDLPSLPPSLKLDPSLTEYVTLPFSFAGRLF